MTEQTTAAPPSLWRRYRQLPRNVLALSLVSLLNDASSELIYPFLPLFLNLTLGASPAVVGAIEGAAESLASLLKLFSGFFSDLVGRRKPLLLIGYGLANIVRPFIGFATGWPQVLGIRLTDRFGKGIRGAPRDAMIADSVTPERRGLAFGFHRAMDHVGAVIGPLLGYALVLVIAASPQLLTASEYRKLFLIAGLPALAAVLVVLLLVREPAHADGPHKKPPSFSLRGLDGNFIYFLVLVALFTLSNSSDAFLILRAQQTGVPTTQIPLLWAALHVVKVLVSLVGGDLSDRLGRKALIVSGWVWYAAIYLGFAFVSTASGAWALFLLYGVYFGLAEGAEKALVADLVPANLRGTAFGLYNLAFGITVLPASILMGAVWGWRGPQTAFIMSAVLGTLAAVLMIGVRTKQKA